MKREPITTLDQFKQRWLEYYATWDGSYEDWINQLMGDVSVEVCRLVIERMRLLRETFGECFTDEQEDFERYAQSKIDIDEQARLEGNITDPVRHEDSNPRQ